MPNSAVHRRYAEVARKLAKQQEGSDGFMWAHLAALWDKVADYRAAKAAQLPRVTKVMGKCKARHHR